jgi:hypothetical protein
MGLKKCIYSTYSPVRSHIYDFVVLTLTHPRKILLVVLQIGKVKDLPGKTAEDQEGPQSVQ